MSTLYACLYTVHSLQANKIPDVISNRETPTK